MSTGLYSGVSGLAIGSGLWKAFPGLWGGATGLIDLPQTLSLNFLSGAPLDSRITFSRGSQATLTDSTGKITYAPNNLILNSEAFEAASWTAFEATVTANATTAPNGTTTADKLSETTANNIHIVYPTTPVNAVAGGIYIISVYAKASERSWLYCFEDSGTNANAFFNLSNGTIGTVGAGGTAAITSVGNGWYRCSIKYTQVGSVARPRFSIATGNNTSSYTGTAGSGIYIWGAQLEQVTYQTTPGTYNSTTPKNLLGYTQEFDNAAWTKSNAFVQTNLLLQSQAFDTASWTPGTGGSVAANTVVAPDGTQTADAYTRASSTTSFALLSQAVSSVSTNPHTFSIWMKRPSGSGSRTVRLRISDVTTSTATSSNFTVTESWQRFEYTRTSAASTGQVGVGLLEGSTGTPLASGEVVDVWGAQLVQGSTAGNYQRTDAAAAAVQYAAPDGSQTADKLVENTAASTTHFVSQAYTSLAVPYVASVYAKKAERQRFTIRENSASGDGATFDLNSGTVVTNLVGGIGSIQSVGNGWYRCSVAFTGTAGGRSVAMFLNTDTGTGFQSYTGDGTSGIYIWGAQLSNSASLDPYVYNPVAAPTSAAYYGPRFDYDPVTLAAKGLLIEEQRTNLATYSQDFTNAAWTKQEMTVTGNAAVAPDGTTTASNCVPTTLSSTHQISSGALVASSACVISVYAKNNGYNTIEILDRAAAVNGASFNLTTGAATNIGTGVGSAVSVGNGWYRCSVVVTTTGIRFYIPSSSSTFAGNGTSGIYLWGAQLEAGSFATSYIPTVASQVTRSADVATMTGANFSNWYNQNAGTISVQGDIIGYTLNQMIVSFTDGTITNSVQVYNDVSGQIQANAWVGGSVFVSYTQNSSYKYALGLENNNVGASINGGAVVSDLSVGPPVAYNRLNIGSRNGSLVLNGHIRSISYYNTRLGNATLQALTV